MEGGEALNGDPGMDGLDLVEGRALASVEEMEQRVVIAVGELHRNRIRGWKFGRREDADGVIYIEACTCYLVSFGVHITFFLLSHLVFKISHKYTETNYYTHWLASQVTKNLEGASETRRESSADETIVFYAMKLCSGELTYNIYIVAFGYISFRMHVRFCRMLLCGFDNGLVSADQRRPHETTDIR